MSSSSVVAEPATLQQRLHAIHTRRIASRFSRGVKAAAWISGSVGLLVVVGGGLVNGN